MGGRNYVITKSIKGLRKEDQNVVPDPSGFKKIGTKTRVNLEDLDINDDKVFNSVYYKKIPMYGSTVYESIIITFSFKYQNYQRIVRQGQIDRAEAMINKGGKITKSRRSQNDPRKFIKNVPITEDGEAATKEMKFFDESIIESESRFDGFYGISTNLEEDIIEVIKINERRWQFEECFRLLITELSVRLVYLQREERIKTHFFDLLLSWIVNTYSDH